MADYYSLLSRAIAAQPQSAPEQRQAVYERARNALFNQLRSVQPPVAEADIEAEGRALDEAIARIELETVRDAAAKGGAAPTPTRARLAEKPPVADKPRPEPAASGAFEPGAFASADAEESPPIQPQRPAAPLPAPPEPAGNSRRVLLIAGVLIAIVGLVAILALNFRERPEDLARLNPDSGAGEQNEAGDAGKLSDRVGGDGETRGGKEQKGPIVPVAQKAELWVAAPKSTAKVETFPGSVVWRLDSMPAGPGQPLAPAIRGEIDIPSAKLKASLVIQKNFDPALSASHTINVSFQLAPGNDFKSIRAIAPLQMRKAEAQTGESVAGVPVPIMENNFLIGLLRGDREARNAVLLRAPMVIDLPMQLEDGRAASITMEKGPGGERVFSDALDAWAAK